MQHVPEDPGTRPGIVDSQVKPLPVRVHASAPLALHTKRRQSLGYRQVTATLEAVDLTIMVP
jgi:hypothetical protein